MSFRERIVCMLCQCVITDSFSRREVLNFHISGFVRRKEALETGKWSVV